jgi:hypothetical protein
MMSHLCNRCVREFLILARTWFTFGLPSKTGCDKDPSAEATLMGGKFYNDVWVNGGRELAHEIIKKNEKDTHDARAEAKRAEETAERERRICIVF